MFKLQEVFSELGIRVLLEKELGSFQTFIFLQVSDGGAKKIPKTVLKTKLKTKQTTDTLTS
jgi:hypothetical protein